MKIEEAARIRDEAEVELARTMKILLALARNLAFSIRLMGALWYLKVGSNPPAQEEDKV